MWYQWKFGFNWAITGMEGHKQYLLSIWFGFYWVHQMEIFHVAPFLLFVHSLGKLAQKMKFVLASAIFLGLAAFVQGQLTINTPWVWELLATYTFHSYPHSAAPVVCQPTLITWSGGTGTSWKYPYFILTILTLAYSSSLLCRMS